MPYIFSSAQLPFSVVPTRKGVTPSIIRDVSLPWPVFHPELVVEQSLRHSL